MTDAAYIFHKDAAEKKSIARSAKNKVRCVGAVKFPSDYLTREEKKKMNSPVTTINLREPITSLRKLKTFPEDMQREYLQRIKDKYHAPDREIALMFGVTPETIARYRKRLNVELHGATNGSDFLEDDWKRFLSGLESDDSVTGPVVRPERTELTKRKPIMPRQGSMTFEGSSKDIILELRSFFATEPKVIVIFTWKVID